jgi:hypothetical protein
LNIFFYYDLIADERDDPCAGSVGLPVICAETVDGRRVKTGIQETSKCQ